MDQQEDDRMEAKVDATTHEMDPISVEKLVKKFSKHTAVPSISTQLSARQPILSVI